MRRYLDVSFSIRGDYIIRLREDIYTLLYVTCGFDMSVFKVLFCSSRIDCTRALPLTSISDSVRIWNNDHLKLISVQRSSLFIALISYTRIITDSIKDDRERWFNFIFLYIMQYLCQFSSITNFAPQKFHFRWPLKFEDLLSKSLISNR